MTLFGEKPADLLSREIIRPGFTCARGPPAIWLHPGSPRGCDTKPSGAPFDPQWEDAPWRPHCSGAGAPEGGVVGGRWRGEAEPATNLDNPPRPGDPWGLPAPRLPRVLSVWRCPAARGWWNEAQSRQKTKSAGHLAGSGRIMQRKSGECGPPHPPAFFFLKLLGSRLQFKGWTGIYRAAPLMWLKLC